METAVAILFFFSGEWTHPADVANALILGYNRGYRALKSTVACVQWNPVLNDDIIYSITLTNQTFNTFCILGLLNSHYYVTTSKRKHKLYYWKICLSQGICLTRYGKYIGTYYLGPYKTSNCCTYKPVDIYIWPSLQVYILLVIEYRLML